MIGMVSEIDLEVTLILAKVMFVELIAWIVTSYEPGCKIPGYTYSKTPSPV